MNRSWSEFTRRMNRIVDDLILDAEPPTVGDAFVAPPETASERMDRITAAYLRPYGTARFVTPEEPPS